MRGRKKASPIGSNKLGATVAERRAALWMQMPQVASRGIRRTSYLLAGVSCAAALHIVRRSKVAADGVSRWRVRLLLIPTVLGPPFLAIVAPDPALAACTVVGGVTTCDTAAPNPWTTRVGGGSTVAGDDQTVNVLTSSEISAGNDNAISMHNNAIINIAGGATVRNNATNATGQYNTGGNTIEIAHGGVLTIAQGGRLLAEGTQGSAEAVNFQGAGNTITNSGLIKATNSVAIWSQNGSGLNTIINTETGVIEAGNGTTSTVIGGSGNGALDFTNRGTIRGSINLAGGNDILRLFTGSTITGNFSGGAGTDAIFLSGTGSATLPGNFVGFETLTKNGSGIWTLSGTITGVTVALVQEGTLVLTGNNASYTGPVIVDPSGTLEARAQSLPPTVTDNGLIRFVQPDAGVYTGTITGTGAVEKTGVGILTLAPAAPGNTYSGGTFFNQGTVAVGADNALGAATGGLTFNGGTLQFNNSFDLSAGRPITLNGGGGTIDTQGFASIIEQGISGSGALAKTGAGTLTLNGTNTYTGGTTIFAGTLQLGNGGTSGSIVGDVINDGALMFNRSDTMIFPGAISGTGSVSQIGTGTTVLTANSIYTGGTTIAGGTLQLGNGGTTGSIVGNVTNNGSLAFNRSNSMDFGGIISGTGAIRQIGSGLTNLTGDNSGFAGTTSVEAGTLAVNGSLCGGMNVLAGGRLQGTGTVCDTTNFAGGTIAPGNSIGTLTVAGNYVGNGGLLEIESVLGGDASPTDRLVVTGNTSGSTNVRVINVGGAGAQTVEGIKIVDVGGASNGAFALQGNYVIQGQQAVVGGAYAYTLQKNGISTPNDGDWYLRSSLANPDPGSPAPPPVPAGPLYQPGVPLYENYAQVLLGMNDLPTLQQRVGNRYWGGSDAMARSGVVTSQPGGSSAPSAVWGRIEGRHDDLQPSTTTGSTYKSDQMKMQAGIDGLALENERGRLIVGLTAQYGLSTANVASFFGNGRIRAQGSGVGGTLTWYGDNGFYVDGQAQTMFYRSDLSSALAGSLIHGNQGFGYGFSAETGKRFGVGNGWSLTPQAQLAYSKVDFDNFTDRFGALVSLGKADSLLGRAGLSLNHQKTWNASGQIVRSDVYGIANVHYEFLSGSNVNVAGTGFASANDRLWGSIGGGGVYSWANGRYSVYGEVSYNASLNNAADNHSYKGTGGFRVVW